MRNLVLGVLIGVMSAGLMAQKGPGVFPDAVTADPAHYSVSFENELVRLVRDPVVGDPWRRILVVAFVALTLAVPAGMAALRLAPRPFDRVVPVVAFTWLGLAFLPLQSRRLDLLTQRARPRLEVLRDRFEETVNLGILDAHRHGILTSASLMVRWPAAVRPPA